MIQLFPRKLTKQQTSVNLTKLWSRVDGGLRGVVGGEVLEVLLSGAGGHGDKLVRSENRYFCKTRHFDRILHSLKMTQKESSVSCFLGGYMEYKLEVIHCSSSQLKIRTFETTYKRLCHFENCAHLCKWLYLWAACSALIIFVSRNFVKAEFLEKRAEAGMGGPNIGTFLDREMAKLKCGYLVLS